MQNRNRFTLETEFSGQGPHGEPRYTVKCRNGNRLNSTTKDLTEAQLRDYFRQFTANIREALAQN